MVFFFFCPKYQCFSPCPPVRIHPKDVDLFRLACVRKQKAKEEADMTVATARAQLARVIRHLHLPEDSFSIRNRHLVSGNGAMNFPVRKLIAIIPAHGTVMAVTRRDQI